MFPYRFLLNHRLLLSLCLGALFVGSAWWRFSTVNPQSGAAGLNAVDVPWFSLIATGAVLGVASLLLLQWANFCLARSQPSSSGSVELFLSGSVPMAAALYFVYQLLAGNLFATTSVSVDAVRDAQDANFAIVTLKIERGDNWLTEIASAAVTTGALWDGQTRWQEAYLPHRPGHLARLAPKETMSTRFRFELKPEREAGKAASRSGEEHVVVTARVVAYGLLWPIPSESYAAALVLPPGAGGDKP